MVLLQAPVAHLDETEDALQDAESLVSGYFFGNSCNLLHASMMQPFASGTI
jgi:hypothetical protein